MDKTYICPYCERELPNKDFFTKNGCVWCDVEYWDEKQKEQE